MFACACVCLDHQWVSEWGRLSAVVVASGRVLRDSPPLSLPPSSPLSLSLPPSHPPTHPTAHSPPPPRGYRHIIDDMYDYSARRPTGAREPVPVRCGAGSTRQPCAPGERGEGMVEQSEHIFGRKSEFQQPCISLLEFLAERHDPAIAEIGVDVPMFWE